MGVDVFNAACRTGDETRARYVAKVVDKEECNRYLCPLHAAVLHRSPNIVQILLEEAAELHIETDNGARTQALHLAAKTGDIESLHVLLRARADVHAETCDGDRPLHFAACRGDSEFVRLLLDADADVNAKNHLGERATDNAWCDKVQAMLEREVEKGSGAVRG